jgi:hypothetical protein
LRSEWAKPWLRLASLHPSSSSLDLVFLGIENPEARTAVQAAAVEGPLTAEQETLLNGFFSAKHRTT